MLTRMPKFGACECRRSHSKHSRRPMRLSTKPAPDMHIAAEDEKRVKAAGRRLVGAARLFVHQVPHVRRPALDGHPGDEPDDDDAAGCGPSGFIITCKIRWPIVPARGCPRRFPMARRRSPTVLDGTVKGQIAAIWTYLADGDKAIFPVGLVTGKIELIAFDEAVIYRNFIEGAGTRAIGVGYPEKLNLAFDANDVRLAMLWHGGFIDAARHWTARGAGFEKPLGDNVLRLPEGPPLAILPDVRSRLAHRVCQRSLAFNSMAIGSAKQQPTFLYSWQE